MSPLPISEDLRCNPAKCSISSEPAPFVEVKTIVKKQEN